MISPKYFLNTLSACAELRDLSGRMHGLLGSVDAAFLFDSIGYVPEFFCVEEFVPPEIASVYGVKSWSFLDSRILWTMDAIRGHFDKKVTINTYKWQGESGFHYRGFRPAGCNVGAKMSQHYFGRATDFDVEGVSSEEVRQEIKNGRQTVPAFRFITAIEDATAWVHVDCRNTGSDDLIVFKP